MNKTWLVQYFRGEHLITETVSGYKTVITDKWWTVQDDKLLVIFGIPTKRVVYFKRVS